MYTLVKHMHLSLVITSICLFVIRFYLVSARSQLINKKLLKILPHIIDTFLLLSAVWLCLLIRQYPLIDPWLSQKLLAVILYIAFGFYTLKKATSQPKRYMGFGLSVASLMLAAHTAMTKSPIFFL